MSDSPSTTEPEAIWDIDQEQLALGAFMLDPSGLDELPAGFGPECFYDPVHRAMYEGLLAIRERGHTPGPFTLKHELAGNKGWEELGGPRYALNIVEAGFPFVGPGVALFLMELRNRRLLQAAAADVSNVAKNLTVEATTAQVEEALLEFDGATEDKRRAGAGKAAFLFVEEIAEAYQAGVSLVGPSTGIRGVDSAIAGLRAPRLHVLAGRPSMGKSALALDMARSAAKTGSGVGYISLEMSVNDILGRLASRETRRHGLPVPYQRFVNPASLSEEEMKAVVYAAQTAGELPIEFSHCPGATPAAIHQEARRMRRSLERQERTLDLLVIDYLGLIRSSRKNDNKVYEIGDTLKDLQAIAERLGVGILLLAQLNRKLLEREDKRPNLSDLRSSGEIEQDADVVMFVHRPEYYDQNDEPDVGTPEHASWLERMENNAGICEVIIAKNRGGPLLDVALRADLPTNTFEEILGD